MSAILNDGFDCEGVQRIYHGEPVTVQGNLPENLLGKRQFEALAASADGLTMSEAAEALGRSSVEGIGDDIQHGRNTLGILDSFQLAGFFPLEAGHAAIGDKKLADLEKVPHALDILEAISVGKRNKRVAQDAGVKGLTVRDRLSDVEAVWEDVEGGLMLTRVANAIRTRYVRAIEAQPGSIDPTKHIALLTLPRLAKLERRIYCEFSRARPSA